MYSLLKQNNFQNKIVCKNHRFYNNYSAPQPNSNEDKYLLIGLALFYYILNTKY
jgi:hypothetical protein